VFELSIAESGQANLPHTGQPTVDDGERSQMVLGAGDFAGSVVGSRFLIQDQKGVSECIVIQLIDRSKEDTAAVVSELARTAAAQIQGDVISTVKFYETYNSAIYSSLPVFEFKQRFSGSLEAYLREYGFETPVW
jgi:hypothetical protein